MSERAHTNHNHEKQAERLEQAQEHINSPEAARNIESQSHKEIEAKSPEAIQKQIEQLSQSVEKLSQTTEAVRTPIHETEKSEYDTSSNYVNKELRSMALQRTMIRVRKQMNPADKLLSKIIHIPAVDKLSEVSSVTVARPSGLLGGGLLSVAGTTAYYYLSRRYGYEYNFSVFLILVAAGFGLGLLSELIWKTLVRKPN